jgi:hypothetical protein
MIKPGKSIDIPYCYNYPMEIVNENIHQIIYENYYQHLHQFTYQNIRNALFHLNKFSVRYGYKND